MTRPQEPKRILDGASDAPRELRDLFSAGLADSPDETRLNAMCAQLALTVGGAGLGQVVQDGQLSQHAAEQAEALSNEALSNEALSNTANVSNTAHGSSSAASMDAAAAVSKAGSTAGLGGASVGSLSTGTVATMTLAAAALIGGGALWGASHFDELETRLARDLAAVEDVPPTRDEATGSDHLPGPTARLDSIEVELPPAHGGTLVETGADETRPSDNRPSDNRPSNNRDAAPSQAPVGKPLGAERAKPEQAREDESSPATPPVPRAAADKPRRPAVREQVPRRLEKRPASSSKRSVRKASERLRARLAARRTTAAPAPEAPAASAVSPTVQERVPGVSEVQMLLQARRALRNNPGRTLRLVEQHRQTFPRGTFEEEREALAIEAMWRVGQQREARRRGTRFLKRFPRSAHAARVRDLLGVR